VKNTFRGVYAVLCTPFAEDGGFDEQAMRRHLRYLLDEGGVHGVIPTGSTGEFTALTDDELHRVIDVTVDEVAGKVPVVAGTAAVATAKTIANTQYAKDAGADGALIVSPFYCHPGTEELYGHFTAVAEAVDLPIMLYNNPSTSGVDIQPDLVARIAECENIVCVKESSGDMSRLSDIRRRCGDRAEVFCGCDTLMLEMFLAGAVGWVSPPANLIPQMCVELYETAVVAKDTDKAMELYFRLLPLFSLFESTGLYIQMTKAGLNLLGRPVGVPRKPLLPPPPELQKQLKDILDDIGA